MKAENRERGAKFDPDEAMCQLNKIGHVSVAFRSEKEVHLQVSSLLLAWRAFISEATSGETLFCNFAQRCLLPVPVSIPTPDEPESFFIGDTPSTDDDPFGWGGDFDQDHQVMSDQDLPLSPVRHGSVLWTTLTRTQLARSLTLKRRSKRSPWRSTVPSTMQKEWKC